MISGPLTEGGTNKISGIKNIRKGNYMITLEEKGKVFEEELKLIFDDDIREFTRLCVLAAPEYLFTDCPASSTGK